MWHPSIEITDIGEVKFNEMKQRKAKQQQALYAIFNDVCPVCGSTLETNPIKRTFFQSLLIQRDGYTKICPIHGVMLQQPPYSND